MDPDTGHSPDASNDMKTKKSTTNRDRVRMYLMMNADSALLVVQPTSNSNVAAVEWLLDVPSGLSRRQQCSLCCQLLVSQDLRNFIFCKPMCALKSRLKTSFEIELEHLRDLNGMSVVQATGSQFLIGWLYVTFKILEDDIQNDAKEMKSTWQLIDKWESEYKGEPSSEEIMEADASSNPVASLLSSSVSKTTRVQSSSTKLISSGVASADSGVSRKTSQSTAAVNQPNSKKWPTGVIPTYVAPGVDEWSFTIPATGLPILLGSYGKKQQEVKDRHKLKHYHFEIPPKGPGNKACGAWIIGTVERIRNAYDEIQQILRDNRITMPITASTSVSLNDDARAQCFDSSIQPRAIQKREVFPLNKPKTMPPLIVHDKNKQPAPSHMSSQGVPVSETAQPSASPTNDGHDAVQQTTVDDNDSDITKLSQVQTQDGGSVKPKTISVPVICEVLLRGLAYEGGFAVLEANVKAQSNALISLEVQEKKIQIAAYDYANLYNGQKAVIQFIEDNGRTSQK